MRRSSSAVNSAGGHFGVKRMCAKRTGGGKIDRSGSSRQRAAQTRSEHQRAFSLYYAVALRRRIKQQGRAALRVTHALISAVVTTRGGARRNGRCWRWRCAHNRGVAPRAVSSLARWPIYRRTQTTFLPRRAANLRRDLQRATAARCAYKGGSKTDAQCARTRGVPGIVNAGISARSYCAHLLIWRR